jgi:uncharacterized membrane protein YphA (DoxX/SURF4 family)
MATIKTSLNGKAYALLIARLVLSAVFLLAALPKLQDPVAFAAAINGFRIIGGELTLWTALILPWLELVIGIGLLIPQIRKGSGLLITLLLLLFIGFHASAWIRGIDIDCGCFGQNESEATANYLWLIIRNLALLAASLAVLRHDFTNTPPPEVTKAAESPGKS